jgi:hypothetical protein
MAPKICERDAKEAERCWNFQPANVVLIARGGALWRVSIRN